ncbi:Proline-rich nuclear receptor coactivator [Heracleum sosnowskyi]|uniref:Proline-rich nuclear receptor coactivator n=1 Tax=Heracleum sosnowskyi TaxID=360622 RepID=A0AAD8J3P2_9APIA|nr:Proline-rich nuclear receptor coactivator [Heracleum sosnowskyi]
MGTQVLRPQDCLTHRIGVSPAAFLRRKTNVYGFRNGIPKVNRPVIRSDRRISPEQRKRSPVQLKNSPENRKRSPVQLRRSPEKNRSPELKNFAKRSASTGDLTYKQNQINNNMLATGKVKILRRGESLVTITGENDNSGGEMAVYGTGRLGPDRYTVMKQVRVGLPDEYAGSAVTMSPSPRALPVPSFFKKGGGGEKFVDDSATKDLRRLLRLD